MAFGGGAGGSARSGSAGGSGYGKGGGGGGYASSRSTLSSSGDALTVLPVFESNVDFVLRFCVDSGLQVG
jgi:hypothetical protein